MSKIRINTQEGCWWLDFGEMVDLRKVVLRGNRWTQDYTDAPWFKEAMDYISDMDYYGTVEDYWTDYDYNWSRLTHEQMMAIIKAYDNCRCSDDDNFIMQVAQILYPDMKFKCCTIRGYSQGDWKDCIYVDDGTIDIKYVEALYFGKVADVTITKEDDSFSDFILDHELWELERNNKLKEELCKRYELNPDETTVYVSDGIVQTIKWKEVG